MRPDNYFVMQDREALLAEFVARKIHWYEAEGTWPDLLNRDLPILVSFNLACVNFSVYYRGFHFFLHFIAEKYYWILEKSMGYKHDSKTNIFHMSSKLLWSKTLLQLIGLQRSSLYWPLLEEFSCQLLPSLYMYSDCVASVDKHI